MLSEKFAVITIILYCGVVPFGTLLKFTADHRSFGLSTLLLVLTVLLRFIPSIISLFSDSILRLFFGLLLVASIASIQLLGVSALDQWEIAYKNQIYLFGYLLFAAAVTSCKWDIRRLRKLVIVLGVFTAISSMLTLIDFYELINIPGVNETQVSTWVDGYGIPQALGPFGHRTAMAGYLGLIIAILFASGKFLKNIYIRWFLWGSAGLALVVLLLSHNRAAPIAILLVLFFIPLLQRRLNMFALLRGGVMVALLIVVLSLSFPEIMSAYAAKFSDYSSVGFSQAEGTIESDLLRIEWLLSAIDSLSYWPLGHGFSELPLNTGVWVAGHSLLTTLLGAVGFVFFIWLIQFILSIVVYLRALVYQRALAKMAQPFIAAIGVWVLIGFMHDLFYIGLGYVSLGIFLALAREAKRMNRQMVLIQLKEASLNAHQQS